MAEEEKDLKKANEPDETDQSSNEDEDDDSSKKEDEITLKKSDYDKVVADRDNYKAGLLNKKAQERELGKKFESGDGSPKKEEASQIDVTKIAEETSNRVLASLGKVNENKAKTKFLKDHPEYIDDTAWNDLMFHFSSKRGRLNIEDVVEDMEDAVLAHKRSTGKLDDYLKAERERGRKEGAMQSRANMAGNAGGVGDSTPHESIQLTPEGEELTRRFGHDPKEVSKIKTKEDRVITIK